MNRAQNHKHPNYELIVVFIIFVICVLLSFVIVPEEFMELIGLNP